MRKVLDTSALLAYLEKERGFEKVQDALAKAVDLDTPLLMSLVNWGEMYYLLMREYGPEQAEKIAKLVDTFPVELVMVDRDLTEQAAVYKANRKLAYVDSFAAALAKLHTAELMTKDREFKSVEDDIKIQWL